MKNNDPLGPLTRTITSILLVSGDPAITRRDRGILRSLGLQVSSEQAQGVRAARWLLKHPVDMVVCDQDLDDMTGREFVALMRLHPAFAALPMVLVSTNNTREAVFEALQSGCSGYLIRPYSIAGISGQLERALELALHVKAHQTGMESDDTSAFEERLAAILQPATAPGAHSKTPPPDPAQQYVRLGNQLMLRQRYEKAIAAFRAALEARPHLAEAYDGLACAWKARGWPDKFREFMHKAALAYLASDNMGKARAAYESLRKIDPHAPSPFHERARLALANGEWAIAARSFELASYYSDDADTARGRQHALARSIARACQHVHEPASAAMHICEALRASGCIADPTELYQQIMGPDPARRTVEAVAATAAPRPEIARTHASGRGMSVRLPILNDFYAVAKHTVKAYLGYRAEEPAPLLELAKDAQG